MLIIKIQLIDGATTKVLTEQTANVEHGEIHVKYRSGQEPSGVRSGRTLRGWTFTPHFEEIPQAAGNNAPRVKR
jgi:hypothetical protein